MTSEEVMRLIIGTIIIVLVFCIGPVRNNSDMQKSLLAEVIVLAVTILVFDVLNRWLIRRKEQQQIKPLKGIMYARLLKIIKELVVNILPPEAYAANNRKYKIGYGGAAAPEIDLTQKIQGNIRLLTQKHIEHKRANGEAFDLVLLERVKEQLKRILDRSVSWLDPEIISHLVRLENYLEQSIELIGSMDIGPQKEIAHKKVVYECVQGLENVQVWRESKAGFFQNVFQRIFGWKTRETAPTADTLVPQDLYARAVCLQSLVIFETIEARAWLDREIDKHFKLETQKPNESPPRKETNS